MPTSSSVYTAAGFIFCHPAILTGTFRSFVAREAKKYVKGNFLLSESSLQIFATVPFFPPIYFLRYVAFQLSKWNYLEASKSFQNDVALTEKLVSLFFGKVWTDQ